MPTQNIYTQNQIEKLGNAIIYLCNNLEKATKTHILKLIYIIEEISIRELGIPFFDLDFYVWQLGPVNQDLFVELTENPILLNQYISTETDGKTIMVKPKKDFSDDEFSDTEILLLQEILDRFKYCTAKELVFHTHKKDSPWYNAALKNGVLDALENSQLTTTSHQIDLSEIIKNNPQKLNFYNSHKEFIQQSKSLKS
jgi:uncharacterized phage-associated protein